MELKNISKRDVVKTVLDGKKPPYVPWSFRFTYEAIEKLQAHWGDDWEKNLGNHFMELGSDIGFFEDLGNGRFQDVFKVVWDRSVEKDIGLPESVLLKEPTLEGYQFPDPDDPRYYEDIEERIAGDPDRFRVFDIGFSLYERAWSLRGMENLLMDFVMNPDFVNELFGRIVDFNIGLINNAVKYDIDAIYFGDDWGQQQGLIMGPDYWREMIYPHLKRMYKAVKDHGKYILIHSCGDVDEVFPDLIGIGLDCFNPFQPEVMDTEELISTYRGTLAFWGGLSTQKTLPFGSPEDVLKETRRLLKLGRDGGYILSPSHAVEGDVSLENILTFVEEAHKQLA